MADGTAGKEIQLWCLAGAGGSATAFAHWRRRFDPRVRPNALELPGRGHRLREPPLHDIAGVLADLIAFVRPRLAARFAFFGHSLGGVIAAECCRRLERDGIGIAEHLFVAGAPAPHDVQRSRSGRPRSDVEVTEYLRRLNGTPPELLDQPDFKALLMPAIRADFAILDSYRYQAETCGPLSCPITVVAGTDDPAIGPDALKEWRRHTSSRFALAVIDGDHFISMRSAAVTDLIQSALLRGTCGAGALPCPGR